MGVSKVIINGTTKVDLTSDTVASDNLLTGYTAHGADGNAVSGSAIAGADCPTFTVTFDSNWETILSVTCDKTHSEITTYINAGILTALVNETDGVESITIDASMVAGGDDSPWTYLMIVNGQAYADLTVNSSSVASFTQPSNYAETLDITENGTYWPTPLHIVDTVNVSVPTGTPRTSSDLTVSGATVTVPAGLYASSASKSVASGTAGTPTATKGTVSNHSVSVTPSVTNTTGYITGSTKTGTSVTVSASELVSGTKTITSNGTDIDVTNYATADVSVPTGTARTSSDLTASGATVTVPAGLYSENATKTIASGSATTPETTITVLPSVTINPSTGIVSASVSGSKSITPTVSAGYISSGTAGTVGVSGASSIALTTQEGTTVTPTESEQTAVAAGKYTLGAVKVGAISSTYVGSGVTRRNNGDIGSYVDDGDLYVTVPDGYYANGAYKQFMGGWVNTPTATKGTVSNHSVSVTPSVTSGTGYITGGTKTGTAVTVSASELVSGTYSVTSSGTKDVTNYASVSVPSGTEGTPTATKGTVSNHSVAVIPSVTNSAGYISGSTKTGTAVTVSASELVSGTKTITSNGTGIDVTNYQKVDVNAAPAHTCTIASNPSAQNCRVLHGGHQYNFSVARSFTFYAGDEIEIEAGDSNNQSGRVFVDGVKVADGDMASVRYSYTAPDNDINITATTGDYEGRVDIAFPAITINTNGKHDVSDYYYADVDVPSSYTCTIIQSASTDSNNCIEYNGTSYYNINDTFTFYPGDTATLKSYGYVYTGNIIVDGVIVKSGSSIQHNNYTYTLPNHDIEVALYGDSSKATGGNTEVIFPTFSIVENDKYDVTGYVYADVSVPASAVVSGTRTITSNATQIDVTNYQYVNVSVPEQAIVVTRTPDAAGGTIVSIDTMGLKAVEPLDVTINGVYTPPHGGAYAPITVNVPGGAQPDEKQVQFIDYDGTVLYEYTEDEIIAMSELPSNPSRAGLVAQGWNWTLEEIVDQLEAMPGIPITIGQMYTTESGNTEIDIELDEDTLDPYLEVCVSGSAVVDWGDGSPEETITGSSLTAPAKYGHIYAAAGSYTITITVFGDLRFQSYASSYVSNNVSPYNNGILVKGDRYDLSFAYAVKAVRLGSNVSIGRYAFVRCLALEYVSCPNGTTFVMEGSYGGWFYGCTSLNGFVLPRNVTGIHSYAFYGCRNVRHISIVKNVNIIGESAFDCNDQLERVGIFGSLTSLYSYAFSNCKGMKNIIIPSTLKSIGLYTFYKMDNLQTITFHSSVSFIGGGAFLSCVNLRNVSIPYDVSSIQNSTFQSCVRLSSVFLPSSLQSIGTAAFAYCTSLNNITLPDKLSSIGSSAFSGCSVLESINIPSSVSIIAANTFYYCSNLRSVTFQGSAVTSIGNSAFYACYALRKINLPSGLTYIGSSAFTNCRTLTDISIPNVTSIYNNAFASCTALKSVTMPISITTLSGGVFSNCTALNSVTIPNGISVIPANLFDSCKALRSMIIPSTVTSIYSYAFRGCSGISEYHVLPTTPPALSGTGVFSYIASDCVIYVPSSVLTEYQTALYWSSFSSKMQGE